MKTQYVYKLGSWLFYLTLFIFLFISSLSIISIYYNLPFSFRLLVVKSGSMEPAIKTGSAVLVTKAKDYAVGDIITYYQDNPKYTITHRIVSVENTKYITKGDNNKTSDIALAKHENVLGKVVIVIPYLGYLVSMTKSLSGFIFFILVPATILIYQELISLKEEIVAILIRKRSRNLIATDFSTFRKCRKKENAKSVVFITKRFIL